MKAWNFLLILALCWPSLLQAGAMREWTNAEGRKLKAELVKYEHAKGAVTVRTSKGRTFNLKVSTLSEADQQWLEELKARMDAWEAKKDTVEAIKFPGKSFMRGKVYYPKELPLNAPPALIVFFGVGGDGSGMVMHLEEQLREIGVMAIGASGFSKSLRTEQRQERFDALMEYIDNHIPHSGLYLGGFNDGVARCLELATYKKERKWKGLLACSPRLGEGVNLSGLAEDLRVVAIVGSHDKSNAEQMDADLQVMRNAKCQVSKQSFEGGNQMPPGEKMGEILTRLLGSR